jgi:hypothetical protein
MIKKDNNPRKLQQIYMAKNDKNKGRKICKKSKSFT